jgi:NADPH-dependent curcumin reductase CurA
MTQIKNTRIVLASRPEGRPTAENFRIEQSDVPELGGGDVLLKTLFLSLDPYMRGRMSAAKSYSAPVEIGAVMEGGTVCQVAASRNDAYAPGDVVLAHTGWQAYSVSNGRGLRTLDPAQAPLSTALGVLGMPGFTAYSGLLTIGQPKAGETVVVAAATGPVGSAVGQLARIKGARAVGIAGGADKCAYLLEHFGFDAAIDHRAPDFAAQLAAACPDGIDVYFENVGGPIWDAVFPLLNTYARVPVCGLIAQYNDTPATAASRPDRLSQLMRETLTRSLTIRGFINREFIDQQPVFRQEMAAWIKDGRVKYKEDVVGGLENAPQAFMGMLEGKNFGKVVVQVSDTQA